MQVFEVIIALLLVGSALAALARRIGAPYPALVAFAGAGLALIPGMPDVVLDPELALALFVAPVLVDAAFDSSPRDLRANWRPIASLALGAVALTVAAVAVVTKLLVPDMSWPVAIALGAIVAPPDAAAATAVLKHLRPPHRILVILQGESLFNDASALLIYRLAVAATITGLVPGWDIVPMLIFVTIGSVLFAVVLARISVAVTRHITDVATAIILQFCGTFLVWIIAEQLHLSAIIAVVIYAMAAARQMPEIVPARIRIPTRAVWEVAVFVLNVLAFILVGFQLKSILARLTSYTSFRYAMIAAAVTVVGIVARMVWVTGAAASSRWRHRPRTSGEPGPKDYVALSGRGALLVGWCGMRGTVTLATALALPITFPFRDMILTTAFGVTLGTLVLQGLTVRPLLLRLKLEDDGPVDREVRLARVEALRSAVLALASHTDVGSAGLVRHRYEIQLQRAESLLAQDRVVADGSSADRDPETPMVHEDGSGAEGDAAVVSTALDAQRKRLVELRTDGTIGDTAFQRVEEELDWTELGWAQVVGATDARAE